MPVGLFLAFVAAASFYRAATQGIVYDEATTYLLFVDGPLEHVFTRYTANNHVLFTLAADATTRLLGVTELTLRLPSVVAGVAYIAIAVELARRVCSTRLAFWLTLGALTLNPLVFDFLSAARGYGLALCLFTLGLLELSREPGRQRCVLASLALGGSICANLAFAFPALALWTTASLIALRRDTSPTHARRLVTRFWLPGMVSAAALLAVPLLNATLGAFFFGADNLLDTARSIVRLSVQHHPTWWTGTLAAKWTESVLTSAVIVTAIAASCGAVVRLLRSRRILSGSPATSCLLLSGGTLAVTLVLLMVAHGTAGVLYPMERTGLYFIPLIVLTLAAAGNSSRYRVVRWGSMAVLSVLTMTAIEQFTVVSYGQWRYDAGSRRIAELISSRAADLPRAVRVAATEHRYQPALEFYRVTRYPDRLAPVVDGLGTATVRDFDIVVVNAADAAILADTCRRLYVDPVSNAEVRDCAPEPAAGPAGSIATIGAENPR